MKLKKPLKKAVARPKPPLDPKAILSESEAWRRMLTDMQQNLGWIPDTPDAKRAVAVETRLAINSHTNGYAHITAVAIVNGLEEPEVERLPGFNQGLMLFLLAEIKEVVKRGNQTYIAAVKNLLRWAMRDDTDDAVSVVVVETAMSLCETEKQRDLIKGSEEYKTYIETFAPILQMVGKVV